MKNRRSGFATALLKNQSNLSTRSNRDGDACSEWIGGDPSAVRIFSDCDHTDGALAEWRTVFEGSGDVIHFPDHCGGVGDSLNQDETLLIGDVLDLEMVDAVGGLCCRAGWHRGIVIGPSRGYVCSEDSGVEKTPGNEDCGCCDEEASCCAASDRHLHIHRMYLLFRIPVLSIVT